MPVPGSINDLNTVADNNSPAGSTPSLPDMDNYMRAHAAFIAQLRDSKLEKSLVSAFALTLLDDADAATMRATLGLDSVSKYSPGDWVLSISTTAPTGTLTPNGQTIGNASSGATARANADTSALFAVLWAATNNTDYPIQTSSGVATTRGASAAADFAANKRFPLPNIQDGDALIAAVSSAVLTRSAGEILAHNHTATTDTQGSHSHAIADSGMFFIRSGAGGQGIGLGTSFSGPNDYPNLSNAGAHSHSVTVNSTGGAKNKAAGLFTRVYIAL